MPHANSPAARTRAKVDAPFVSFPEPGACATAPANMHPTITKQAAQPRTMASTLLPWDSPAWNPAAD